MKQHFLARVRTALDEIEQNAPADLALFEYVDLLTAQIPHIRTLFEAAATKDLHTTRALLLRHGVDVDAQDTDGMTTMYIAAAHGHTELVEVLADEGGADVNLGTLEDSTLQLVEAWKDNPPGEWFRSLERGAVFPLYIAARNGHVAPSGRSSSGGRPWIKAPPLTRRRCGGLVGAVDRRRSSSSSTTART